jgi:hypothetical protein
MALTVLFSFIFTYRPPFLGVSGAFFRYPSSPRLLTLIYSLDLLPISIR